MVHRIVCSQYTGSGYVRHPARTCSQDIVTVGSVATSSVNVNVSRWVPFSMTSVGPPLELLTTLGLVMLFSAGSFLYVATVDTLPDIHNPETGRATVVPMLMGIALVGVLLLLASQMGWLDHGH